MQLVPDGELDLVERARHAADLVTDEKAVPVELATELEARAAVQQLSENFEQLRGGFKTAFERAGDSASQISSDRLQYLAEFVQNADDVDATEVHIQLLPSELRASHNGEAMRLKDVFAIATPYSTTKGEEADATGRFGIGLSAFRAISDTLEVHCAPYHIRIGEPPIAWLDRPERRLGIDGSSRTTFVIPLSDQPLEIRELVDWFDGWDDAALLFLRQVRRITLLNPSGHAERSLSITRAPDERLAHAVTVPQLARLQARADDGRSWAVYGADVPSPVGVQRVHKATGPTTPVAVAFPLGASKSGHVYARLPVAPLDSPLLVNAQFDPITNRRELSDTEWNRALVDRIAGVWSEAVLDLFECDPHAAWHAIPLPRDGNEGGAGLVIRTLEEAVLQEARRTVASRLSFSISGHGHVRLAQLAVEAKSLEGILQDAETAQLAGLRATVPADIRDPTGRWRLVLDDWRANEAGLPEEVSVEQALELVGDEGRPVASSIALVAAALDEGFGTELLRLPCVIASDGRRLLPPAGDSVAAFSVGSASLAAQLGIATLLHPAHLAAGNGAPEALAWLRERGALLDRGDDTEVLHRLAAAGQRGGLLDAPLTDEQLRALRDALERLTPDTQDRLGPNIGRAVRLEAHRFDTAGRKRPSAERPVDAYLPRAIETRTDSFAAAAATAPGPVWLSSRYKTVLRSEVGREGIGAQKFLRLLGAETAPRLRPHPSLNNPSTSKHYSNDGRRGLPQSLTASPESRAAAMQERGASHTLEDHDCPDLLAVISDISRERHGERRRERAGALLSALGRAWELRLSPYAEVEAADGSWGWKSKGRVPAFWLAQAGDIAWLDDESGVARKPTELRVRTPGNEALRGDDWPNFLHADIDRPTHRVPLAALGTRGDPNRSELVGRLRELRRASQQGSVETEDVRHGAELVYRALARSLDNRSTDADLTPDQLRRQFDRHSLVLTDHGWLMRSAVFAGPPIFGTWRPFAPSARECATLWKALRLRTPSAEDCVAVIKEVTRRRRRDLDPTEEGPFLDTLRALAQHFERGAIVGREVLRGLALRTSTGWERGRPVYATDDPVLAAGLRSHLPIWRPGGQLGQFRSLLEPLRISEIRTSDSQVIDPEVAAPDRDLTGYFRTALKMLRDDLQRNEPELAHGITTSWDSLAEFVVKVHPHLRLAVAAVADEVYVCAAKAMVDPALATVFVADELALGHVDGGGRALAGLFVGEGRRVAHAWRAAWDRAGVESEVQRIELASDRVAREEREFAARSETSTPTNVGRDNRTETRSVHREASIDEREEQTTSRSASAFRVLADPDLYAIADRDGRIAPGVQRRSASDERVVVEGNGELAEPTPGSRAPQNRLPLRGFSDVDRENVGFEFFRKALRSKGHEITDLRTQPGVGADAVDESGNFYELKVFARTEPNDVTLTASEVQRARTADSFFLVVVSNIEGDDARPKVRLIPDPLQRLHPTERGSITLTGVRETSDPPYEFAVDASQP